jgi:hypothetical protein
MRASHSQLFTLVWSAHRSGRGASASLGPMCVCGGGGERKRERWGGMTCSHACSQRCTPCGPCASLWRVAVPDGQEGCMELLTLVQRNELSQAQQGLICRQIDDGMARCMACNAAAALSPGRAEGLCCFPSRVLALPQP